MFNLLGLGTKLLSKPIGRIGLVLFAMLGVLALMFVSYIAGKHYGVLSCKAASLEQNIRQQDSLITHQQEQIGEALRHVEMEREIDAELKKKFDSLNLNQQRDCIPTSVWDGIREYRAKARSSDNKPSSKR